MSPAASLILLVGMIVVTILVIAMPYVGAGLPPRTEKTTHTQPPTMSLNSVEPKPRKRVLPPPPARPRTITWSRVERGPKLMLPDENGTKPLMDLADLGMETITAPALYDNGVFVVVDSVKGLQYDILRQITDPEVGPLYSNKRWVLIKRVVLSLEDACREADELKQIMTDNPDLFP